MEEKGGMVSEFNPSTRIQTSLILAWPMAQHPFPLELLSSSFKRGDGTTKTKQEFACENGIKLLSITRSKVCIF